MHGIDYSWMQTISKGISFHWFNLIQLAMFLLSVLWLFHKMTKWISLAGKTGEWQNGLHESQSMIWFFTFKTIYLEINNLLSHCSYIFHKWHLWIAKVSPAYLQHILWHPLISAAQVNRNDGSIVAAQHWQRNKNKSCLRGVKMQFICLEFGVTFWRTIKWSESEKCAL